MSKPQIELKQRRDIGDVISTFFDFFKQNLIPFMNVFIRYNGIFILAFLGVSYLMVTGFAGSIRSTGMGGIDDSSNDMLIIFGVLGFLVLFIITSLLNYSLAASYLVHYEKQSGLAIEKKDVWAMVSSHIGKIIVFIILLILLLIPFSIVYVIVGIIPVIGFFGNIALRLGFNSWVGVAFMSIFYEERDVTDSFGEGWRLVSKHLWKSMLVNLVIGLLLGLLLLVVLMIPGILIGVYAFHSLESGVDLAESPIATVVWTVALTIVLILYTFIQAATQLGNGILYFSLHEETYNTNTRSRIEQIGVSE